MHYPDKFDSSLKRWPVLSPRLLLIRLRTKMNVKSLYANEDPLASVFDRRWVAITQSDSCRTRPYSQSDLLDSKSKENATYHLTSSTSAEHIHHSSFYSDDCSYGVWSQESNTTVTTTSLETIPDDLATPTPTSITSLSTPSTAWAALKTTKRSSGELTVKPLTRSPSDLQYGSSQSPAIDTPPGHRGKGNLSRAKSLFFRQGRRDQDEAVSDWRQSVSQLHISSPSKMVLPTMYSDSTLDDSVCRFVLHELYTTEQSYLRLLTLIQTLYMQPMEAALRAKDPLVNASDMHALFRYLPQLRAVSQSLLVQLDLYVTTCRTWRPVHVARAFTLLKDDLAVFLQYAIHHQTHLKAIRRACQRNAFFVRIDQECLSRRETNRMGMSDYLIAPIQRVPRYCLLLKDLLKHTKPTNPEYAELETTHQMMMALAAAMNAAQQV